MNGGNSGWGVLAAGFLVAAMAAPTAEAAPRKPRVEPVGIWLFVGGNRGWVEDADLDCPGGQFGIAAGREGYVRLQQASVGYESADSTDTCDAGPFGGDSSISETSLTGGFLARGGLFFGGGLAKIRVDDLHAGQDDSVAPRFELGWTSRRRARGFLGWEALLFHVPASTRSYSGLALNVAFGLHW